MFGSLLFEFLLVFGLEFLMVMIEGMVVEFCVFLFVVEIFVDDGLGVEFEIGL